MASSPLSTGKHLQSIDSTTLRLRAITLLLYHLIVVSIPSAGMASPNSPNPSNANYGTVQPEKNKLPFYRVLSRSSTDSTRSTDALLEKQAPKKQSKPVSTKAIYDCEPAVQTDYIRG